MRRLAQALLLLLIAPCLTCVGLAQEPTREELERQVLRLVAALAAPARAERLAAQEALLALPDEAVPLLDLAAPPPGFEPRAALDYVRRHPPRAPRPLVVPAGTYRVGSSAPADRNPPREVTLATFRIDDVEVTCFQWWRFARTTGASTPPDWIGGRYRYGGESLPVGNVAPEEAQQFAAWAGGRLPTADEWEVAAHGGWPRPYPWGDEFEGHLRGAPARGLFGGGEPPEVASEPEDRSPFGGHDFCSSLMEWVKLPDGGIAARGGSYLWSKDLMRLTRAPDAMLNRRRSTVGLRVADRARPGR
jgi:formylglycine-generating enzyme required for sulfatase activity